MAGELAPSLREALSPQVRKLNRRSLGQNRSDMALATHGDRLSGYSAPKTEVQSVVPTAVDTVQFDS